MKKLILSLILVLFFTLLDAQSPLVKMWDKRYGGTVHDLITIFMQTDDGGYILGGYSHSGIGGDKSQDCWGNWDYWIIKIDSIGNKQWDKRFGGIYLDELFALQQTSDKGYILGGFTNNSIDGDKTQPNWDTTLLTYDYWILKLDSTGNKQWDKRFGGTNWDEFYSLQQTSEGGYILGGFSNSDSSGDKTQSCQGGVDYWIVKLDYYGNKQWDKRFGGLNDDKLFSLQQTTDGGFILGGYSNSGSSGDKTQISQGGKDYWIVKTDSIGNKQWDKSFGASDDDFFRSIRQTADGGYILGGYTVSNISGDKTQPSWGSFDYWIIKIDSSGNKQWDRDYGGDGSEDEFDIIFQTTDGGYLIEGSSYSNISGNKTESNLGLEQGWIIKIDSNGNFKWDKTITTNGHDEFGFAIESNDSCNVIVKQTNGGIGGLKSEPNWDSSNVTYDYWVIKLCDTTATTFINQISNTQSLFSIYPNPTNTILNLIIRNKENIVVTNLLGEIVLQKTVKGKVELDVSSLSSGIYFIKAGSEVRKFVKE